MAKDLFATLDLNLIRTFQIIYQERNLNRAAERLFVTQPAMSKALAKLRHHFNDELFIRSYHGLQSTDFSDNLYKNLGPALESLSSAVNSQFEFEPQQLSGRICISLSPFLIQAIGDKLYQRIHAEAPDVQLILLNWSAKTLTHIHNQEVDLGINYELPNSYKDIIGEEIGTEKYSIYVRENHPYKGKSITQEQIAEYEIVTIANSGWNLQETFVEREFKKKGLVAKMTFRSELPSALVKVVLNSDAMFPSSRFLNGTDNGLRKIDIENTDEIISFCILSYSYKKVKTSQRQTWLINHIKALVK